jgi:host factor-I protein
VPRKPKPGKVLKWAPREEAAELPGDHRPGEERLEVPLDAAGTPAGDASGRPEAPVKTGAEEQFYKKHMLRRTPMVVVMRDGQELRGWIEWYDRDVVKLHSLTRANLFIPKAEIKYVYKHADGPHASEPVPTPPPLVPVGRPERRRGRPSSPGRRRD